MVVKFPITLPGALDTPILLSVALETFEIVPRWSLVAICFERALLEIIGMGRLPTANWVPNATFAAV